MKGGVDKGFCLSYWNLSYRRKLIRTLWGVALALLTIALLQLFEMSSGFVSVILAAIFIVAGAVQAISNYRQWKCEKELEIDN